MINTKTFVHLYGGIKRDLYQLGKLLIWIMKNSISPYLNENATYLFIIILAYNNIIFVYNNNNI